MFAKSLGILISFSKLQKVVKIHTVTPRKVIMPCIPGIEHFHFH